MSVQDQGILGSEQSMSTYGLQQALEHVGNANKYQWRILSIMCFAMMAVAFHVSGGSYIFIHPPLLCDGKPCPEDDYCSQDFTITVDTEEYRYETVVTQFQLWCDKQYLATVAQSIYFLGSIIGGSIMSFVGDKHGRRLAYIYSQIIFTIGVVGIVTSTSIYQYIVFNAITGIGALPPYLLNYVILNETCGQQFRQKAVMGPLIAWSLSAIICAGAYFWIVNWKIAYGCFVVCPAIISSILVFTIQETPQFYSAQRRIPELVQSLDRIAKINGTQSFSAIMPQVDQYLDSTLKIVDEKVQKQTRTYTYADLFKYKSIRNPSFGFIIISFTLHLLYYGGAYSIGDVASGDGIFIMGALMSLTELITNIVVKFVITHLLRRTTLIICYFACITFCFGFLFFGLSADSAKVDCDFCLKQIFVIILGCLIKIFNSFAFAIQGQYANEVYPTCVRSLGTGFLFTAGIFGSFTSPYAIALGQTMHINPYFIIGGISISGPFACLLVPETLGRELEDNIREEVVGPQNDYDRM